MIKSIYGNCTGLSVDEMKTYLKSEIEKYPIESYKTMNLEMKIYMHKLFSFLWFTMECDDKKSVLWCMNKMCDTKGFYDRSKLVEQSKLVKV